MIQPESTKQGPTSFFACYSEYRNTYGSEKALLEDFLTNVNQHLGQILLLSNDHTYHRATYFLEYLRKLRYLRNIRNIGRYGINRSQQQSNLLLTSLA
jgi:hypothetical protein